jgi:hypothetical protein
MDAEELRINRINTEAFIDADPTLIVLKTRMAERTPSGGFTLIEDVPRMPQFFKLVMTSPAGGSIEQRTEDGTERQVDFQLIGAWDAQIAVGDYWDDVRDQRWEVKAMIPDNGYEKRAVVEAHGKVLEGG